MSRVFTIADIKERVLDRSDMKNSDFISDTELLSYINSSYAELYDILVDAHEDFFVNFTQFTLVSGTSLYTCPTNFYKNLGVDFTSSVGSAVDTVDDWVELKRFNFRNRNRYDSPRAQLGRSLPSNLMYKLLGNAIAFVPTVNIAGTVRVWYVPAPTIFTTDTQVVDGVAGWEEYIVVDAARKCLMKEESNTDEFVAEKKLLLERIMNSAQQRDAGEPERVADMTDRSYNYSGDY